jgi:phosphatidylinositol alpha-1,6-mannosyltransferase
MRPKYLLITYDFPPAGGGISRYYHSIFSRFPRGQVLVWSVRNRGKKDVGLSGGVRIVRSRLHGGQVHSLLSLIVCARELARIIREEQPTFLLCGNIRPFGPLAYLLSRRFKIPFILLTHGLDVARALTKIGRNPFYGLLQRSVMRKARWIVANSSYTRNLITSKIPSVAARTRVVHPGVDTGHFRPRRRPMTAPVLLSVGRLTERKGVDEVIRCLPLVLEKYPGLTYDVVGDGEYRERLVRLTGELGLRKTVKFHHQVPDGDLRSWYDGSDVFLMVTKPVKRPEDVEGFGIVYLEASASGLPVVASPSGGVADAVVHGKTGLLVSPEPGAIAAAILRLLADGKLRDRLGKNGRRRCVREFQWSHSAEKLRLLLES